MDATTVAVDVAKTVFEVAVDVRHFRLNKGLRPTSGSCVDSSKTFSL